MKKLLFMSGCLMLAACSTTGGANLNVDGSARAQCSNGDKEACITVFNEGQDFLSKAKKNVGTEKAPKYHQIARSNWELVCKNGIARGCSELAHAYAWAMFGTGSGNSAMENTEISNGYILKACKLGNTFSCAEARAMGLK